MSFSEWREVRLGDVIVFNPRESIAKGKMSKKIAMEKLKPFYKYIDEFEWAEFNGGAKFRNDDTLLARITPCLENGKTAQVTILDNDEVGFGSTEFIVLREKENTSDKDFIYYLSISQNFRDLAIKSMEGTTGRQRVQQSVLENTVMSLPPLPEQKAIAETLSCLDDKIELNNKINANLEQTAQAIFKSWFVDFEPFQDGEFVESELGMIPKGWRVDRVYKLMNVIYGAPFSSTLFNENKEGYPLIRIRDLKTFNPQYYTDENHPNLELVQCGDIIFGMDAEFRPCIWQGITGVLNQRVCKVASNHKTVCNFFMYFVLKPHLDFIEYYKVGTTVSHIGKSDIDKISIVIPPYSILEQYKDIVEPMYQQLLINSQENIGLAELRNSLLPKLMSGEIDVSQV